MASHSATDLERFLRELDRNLTGRHVLIIIGGAAASMAYHASRTTHDIDTANPVQGPVQRAAEAARQTTGLNIPMTYASIFDGPVNYEDRLQTQTHLGLDHLLVRVPERHDLALMKVIRGEEHDLQVIREMHEHEALSLDVLLGRFQHEMTHVMGQLSMIRLNFLALIELLFGKDQAAKVEDLTRDWGQSWAQ
jgi:hypothetical protein